MPDDVSEETIEALLSKLGVTLHYERKTIEKPKGRQAGSFKKLGESKDLVYKLPDDFNEPLDK